jgi:hypothetical protein
MSGNALQDEVFMPGDIAEAIALWKRTEGLGVGESDTPQAVTKFLAHNPGFSLQSNPCAELFWAPTGWTLREDLLVYSSATQP